MLQHNSKFKSKLDQIWDKLWSGRTANPLTAIEQIKNFLPILQTLSEESGENLEQKIAEYRKIEGEAKRLRDMLKKELMEALERA